MENSDEYKTPEIYDAEYGSYTDDFNVFCDLKNQGLALDLGCGTGRLILALAKSGLTCIGMDISEPMLERARLKSTNLPISYILEDMRSFQLDDQFDLITLAGNGFQGLLTDADQDQLFTHVHSHLKKDGIFAFNTRNPTPDELKTKSDFESWHIFKDPEGNNVQAFGKQTYNPRKGTVSYTTKRIWSTHETHTDIEIRFTPADNLLKKLDTFGFDIINIYGDFQKNPFTNESRSIILICKRKS